MKILYVTAECWPFMKTGGLGDVSYALPKALKKEGVDIRVIMPKYSTIPSYLKDKFKKVVKVSFKEIIEVIKVINKLQQKVYNNLVNNMKS